MDLFLGKGMLSFGKRATPFARAAPSRPNLLQEVHMKIWITGSRSIKTLPKEVQERLVNAVRLGHTFLIGPAPGVDTLVKNILEREGATFEIFSPKGKGWEATDQAMAEACHAGFAIWDGVSWGTRKNLKRLERQRKRCLLWRHSSQTFEWV